MKKIITFLLILNISIFAAEFNEKVKNTNNVTQKVQKNKKSNKQTNKVHTKLSKNGICHTKGSTYYNRVKNYQSFDSLEECLKYGRMPKR